MEVRGRVAGDPSTVTRTARGMARPQVARVVLPQPKGPSTTQDSQAATDQWKWLDPSGRA